MRETTRGCHDGSGTRHATSAERRTREDDVLVARLAQGDAHAQDAIVERFRDRTWAVSLQRQDPSATARALQDTLGVHDGGFEDAENRAYVDGLLARSPRQEREILRMRFVEDLVQAEIAARIGRSQMQVSRIIRGALDKLRSIADRR
jgi:RNA polymerase sigma factor (sigma-70 family)